MNAVDTAAVKAVHRAQAAVLQRRHQIYPLLPGEVETFPDARPVESCTCPACGGFRVIDRYVSGEYHPQPCGRCDQNGLIECYAP